MTLHTHSTQSIDLFYTLSSLLYYALMLQPMVQSKGIQPITCSGTYTNVHGNKLQNTKPTLRASYGKKESSLTYMYMYHS